MLLKGSAPTPNLHVDAKTRLRSGRCLAAGRDKRRPPGAGWGDPASGARDALVRCSAVSGLAESGNPCSPAHISRRTSARAAAGGPERALSLGRVPQQDVAKGAGEVAVGIFPGSGVRWVPLCTGMEAHVCGGPGLQLVQFSSFGTRTSARLLFVASTL